jgi:hypothetical protein
MANDTKNAWLIGLYSLGIETRIKSLGYKLTWLFPYLEKDSVPEEKPSLIVFTHDLNTVESMHVARDLFPEALLISFPARIEGTPAGFDHTLQPNTAMSRLLTSIKEREYSRDN